MTNDFRRDMRSKQLNLDAYDTGKIKFRYLEIMTQFWSLGSAKQSRFLKLVSIVEVH